MSVAFGLVFFKMSYLLNVVFRQTYSFNKLHPLRFLNQYTANLRNFTIRCSQSPVFNSKADAALIKNRSTRPFDTNTNVVKDVILFKYENPKFFKYMNIFGISQLLFWTYLAHFAFTTLKDAPVNTSSNTEPAWYEKINLGENKYRNTITILSFLIGKPVL